MGRTGRIVLWVGGLFAGLLLVVVLAALLYLRGVYRFAYPDTQAFPVRGIDVSHHQGVIDWKRIAAQNIRFVYLKASEGGDWRDASFGGHLEQAHAAGLAVGAYHYFTLCAPGPIQARNFIAAAPAVPHLNLPPAIDLEYVGNCGGRPGQGRLARELKAFIAIVKHHYGKTPVIYSTQTFFEDYLDKDPAFRAYPLWVRNLYGEAQWSRGRTVMFRQFANHARLDGIKGSVDLDLYIGSKAQFAALTGDR
jgi:lysozyme